MPTRRVYTFDYGPTHDDMECPACQAEVSVHHDSDYVVCPECKQLCEVSWDGAPDGGSGLVAIDNPITEDEHPCH